MCIKRARELSAGAVPVRYPFSLLESAESGWDPRHVEETIHIVEL